MLIGTFQSFTKMPDIHVHFDNEPLNQVNVAKYLGKFIDSNLKGMTILINWYLTFLPKSEFLDP